MKIFLPIIDAVLPSVSQDSSCNVKWTALLKNSDAG